MFKAGVVSYTCTMSALDTTKVQIDTVALCPRTDVQSRSISYTCTMSPLDTTKVQIDTVALCPRTDVQSRGC